MLLGGRRAFRCLGLGLNVPYAESGGLHLLLIASVAVALAAFSWPGSSPAVEQQSLGLDGHPQPRAQSM